MCKATRWSLRLRITSTIAGIVFYFISNPCGFGYFESSPDVSPRDESGLLQDSQNRSLFAAKVGGSRWGGVHAVRSLPPELAKYEGFPLWGLGIELSFHRLLKRVKSNELRVGGDWGIFYRSSIKSFDTTIYPAENTVPMDLPARGMYLTPSIQYVFGNVRRFHPRPYLGGGAGVYGMDILTMLGGMELDTYYRKVTVGGYVSGGVAIPVSHRYPDLQVLLDGKLHFMRFGRFESFSSTSRNLRGPMFMLQLGFTFH